MRNLIHSSSTCILTLCKCYITSITTELAKKEEQTMNINVMIQGLCLHLYWCKVKSLRSGIVENRRVSLLWSPLGLFTTILLCHVTHYWVFHHCLPLINLTLQREVKLPGCQMKPCCLCKVCVHSKKISSAFTSSLMTKTGLLAI